MADSAFYQTNSLVLGAIVCLVIEVIWGGWAASHSLVKDY